MVKRIKEQVRLTINLILTFSQSSNHTLLHLQRIIIITFRYGRIYTKCRFWLKKKIVIVFNIFVEHNIPINNFFFLFFSVNRYSSPKLSWFVEEEMGRKVQGTNDTYDLDSLISPIYAMTVVGPGTNSAGWMGYKAVPVDNPKPSRSHLFLIDTGLSAKTLDAILRIFIICLVLFIIINCMCKFVWLFLK